MLVRWLWVIVLAGCTAGTPQGSFVQNETGIIVTPAENAQRRVRLEVRTDRTVRVTSVDDANLELPKSLMVVASTQATPKFEVEKGDGEVVLATEKLAAHVSLANGAVAFKDRDGNVLLAEAASEPPAAGVTRRFNPGTDGCWVSRAAPWCISPSARAK
jgi:hypothetical protein